MGRARVGLGIVLGVALGAIAWLEACGGGDRSGGAADAGSPRGDGAGGDVTVDSGADTAGDDAGDDVGCGLLCNDGATSQTSTIPTTCADAIKRNSYIACDFYPTVTLNPVWPQFDYAVAVSNPQTSDVGVTVSGGALKSPLAVKVPAGQVQAIPLPWVDALKGPSFDINTVVPDPGRSRIVAGGAYHLTADLPVSVYQFSALEYEIDAGTVGPDGGACPGFGDAGAGNHCYSFSNDASLLLPANVATGNYGVLAWPSFAATPGFLAVVATKAATHVTVFPGGRVQGVPNVGPAMMVRGDSYTYTLGAGDVLEMFSDTGDIHTPRYSQDLSGTIVSADSPVITYAGHGCTFIPENKKACDHLESSMLPVESLGFDYIATYPHTPHGEHEWVRIMALYDNTKIAFDPPVSGYNGAVLGTGDVLDLFDVDKPFAIHANGRINVAHYELGEYASWPGDAGTPQPDLGDPSECPAIPISQYRQSYTFLAPSTYAENWIDVVAPLSTTVTLDGTQIPAADFKQVGSQPFAVAHEQLPNSGQGGHTIGANARFGLYVYGYGSRTSYMYPGGLDITKLNLPKPPQ